MTAEQRAAIERVRTEMQIQAEGILPDEDGHTFLGDLRTILALLDALESQTQERDRYRKVLERIATGRHPWTRDGMIDEAAAVLMSPLPIDPSPPSPEKSVAPSLKDQHEQT